MKRKFIGILMYLFVVIIGMSFTSCEKINAGHEGIKVNLYGDSKGVENVSLVTGVVWYNPFTQEVYEYPTFVQSIDYPSFEVNSKDGSKFTIDPSMLVNIEKGKSPQVFVKYRQSLDEVIKNVLFISVKDAARIEFNNYTAEEIVSNRSAVDKSLEDRVRESFNKEGFILEQLTPGIAYPKSYEEAINAKNKAVQEKLRIDNEVEVAKAEAEKLLVAARAEAEANKLREQALTPAILEKMWIEAWDGKLPVYGAVPTIFKDISK